MEYEPCAATAESCSGQNIHPGTAKGKMKNASLLAMEFNALLLARKGRSTPGYEGVPTWSSAGSVEHATHHIVRDHCAVRFQERKTGKRAAAWQRPV